MLDSVLGLFQVVFSLLVLFWPLTLGCLAVVLWRYWQFRASGYRAATGHSFLRTHLSKGTYGEYLTFRVFEACPGEKFLFANSYLPTDDGQTTEVDLIMVHDAGVFVVESKNYSGWIYGNEDHKLWTQVMSKRRKYKFFNPIWQNRGHITALEKALAGLDIDRSEIRSYIVFSNRCTLRNITVNSPDVVLLKRHDLKRQLWSDVNSSRGAISSSTLERAQTRLAAYVLVDDELRLQHISDVNGR